MTRLKWAIDSSNRQIMQGKRVRHDFVHWRVVGPTAVAETIWALITATGSINCLFVLPYLLIRQDLGLQH